MKHMIPSFVISLQHDTLRRTHMRAELKKAGITAEFFDAVDGKKLTAKDYAMVDEKKTMRVLGKKFENNEIGCYLSHYRLWERMVREKIPYALIMEDDITISPNISSIIKDLIANKNHKWRVVRLTAIKSDVRDGTTKSTKGKLVQKLKHGNLYAIQKHPLGLGAYVMSYKGAKTMLPYAKKMFVPIDLTLDRYWENGILPYVVRPIPAHHKSDFISRIGNRAPTKHTAPPTLYKILKRFQRIKDGLHKRLFWIFH